MFQLCHASVASMLTGGPNRERLHMTILTGFFLAGLIDSLGHVIEKEPTQLVVCV